MPTTVAFGRGRISRLTRSNGFGACAAWNGARRGSRGRRAGRPRRLRADGATLGREPRSRRVDHGPARMPLASPRPVWAAKRPGGMAAPTICCCALATWPSMSRRKCTVQRCHRHPRAPWAMAWRSPSLGVGDAQQHAPSRPRAFKERRKSRQKLSVSASPTSRPSTSRPSRLVHPVGRSPAAFLPHPRPGSPHTRSNLGVQPTGRGSDPPRVAREKNARHLLVPGPGAQGGETWLLLMSRPMPNCSTSRSTLAGAHAV